MGDAMKKNTNTLGQAYNVLSDILRSSTAMQEKKAIRKEKISCPNALIFIHKAKNVMLQPS
jgi:hypothetical protein